MKFKEYFNAVITCLGFVFSLENIESILGLTLLALSILNVLLNGIAKIISKLKDGDKSNDFECIDELYQIGKDIDFLLETKTKERKDENGKN